MSDDPPVPSPTQLPEPLPPEPPRGPPSFWALFGVGCGLVVVSGGFCLLIGSSLPFFFGLAVAIFSLFFPGRRGVFIGYISTIGIGLLVAAVICGVMFSNAKFP